ncbi:MAG: EamA family transporter [Actinomycetia bacterium]|nr:EamA family transporter [Actinomycetes bacterium]
MAGTLSGLVTVFYLLGVQADATAAVVTASMFPAFSVGIGWLFFHDHVGRIQIGGVVLVLLGVVGVVAA